MKKRVIAVLVAFGIVFSFSSASMASGPPLCNGNFFNHPCIW